jgi:hypothetical protein
MPRAECDPYAVLPQGYRTMLTDIGIHDLRRTPASWQAKQGTSLAIIGKSPGHSDWRSTAVYSRLQNASVRQSVTQVTRAMLAAANEES